MAPESGKDTDSLSRMLTERPGSFDFFQAVRLMHRLFPSRVPVGRASDPDKEAVRFRSSVSLVYPAVEIKGLEEEDGKDAAPEMTVAFMGIASPSSFGSLPLRYAEFLLELEKRKNRVLRDFFDLFNHRFISQFYRAWEKHNLPVSHEREERGRIETALYSLIGMGLPGLSSRLPFPDRALLYRAGILGRRPLPASSLEGLITSYFKVPAEVIQFVPRWYDVAEEEITRLGEANSTLGEDALIGSSVRLHLYGFRIRLGPLGWDEFMDFLPPGAGFRSLVELAYLAVGKEFEFDIQLVLKAPEVPDFRLSSAPGQLAYLGWSTWVKSRPFDHDPSDAVFDSQVLPPREIKEHVH